MHKYYIEPVVLCETRTDNVTKIHKNLPLTNHPFIVKQDDVISNARNESFVTNLDKFSLFFSLVNSFCIGDAANFEVSPRHRICGSRTPWNSPSFDTNDVAIHTLSRFATGLLRFCN